jgi:hypothetical protein
MITAWLLKSKLQTLFSSRLGPASAGERSWGMVRARFPNRGVTFGADINDSRAFVAFVTNEGPGVEDGDDWEIQDDYGRPIQIVIPMAASSVAADTTATVDLAVAAILYLMGLIETGRTN